MCVCVRVCVGVGGWCDGGALDLATLGLMGCSDAQASPARPRIDAADAARDLVCPSPNELIERSANTASSADF